MTNGSSMFAAKEAPNRQAPKRSARPACLHRSVQSFRAVSCLTLSWPLTGTCLGSTEVLLVRQIVDQFAPGLFGRVATLLAVMPPFARAELEQIGRKMACNEYFGASMGANRTEYSCFL